MAVPKTKTSKSKKRTRSAANFKAHARATSECPHCHEQKQPHRVCKACGYYKGAKVLEVEKEKKKD
ncbi:MAG: 50S ribosomal protein L32 [Firmicutes bacterium]|nr:50S ribosomal protein L32 [Bacillota bacterium]